MFKIKTVHSLIVCMMIGLSMQAQSISGRVVEWDEPMKMEMPVVGANVYWLNTIRGTTSDAEGNFTGISYGCDFEVLGK